MIACKAITSSGMVLREAGPKRNGRRLLEDAFRSLLDGNKVGGSKQNTLPMSPFLAVFDGNSELQSPRC